MGAQADLFYNTILLDGDELKEAQQQAAFQSKLVLDLYNKFRGPLTPSDVWQILISAGHTKILLTSVRRAITNLTNSGKLLKMESKKQGKYGMPEHKWILAA